jgi:hypothetical protein
VIHCYTEPSAISRPRKKTRGVSVCLGELSDGEADNSGG